MRGIRLCAERQSPKGRTKVQEVHLSWLWTRRPDWILTLGPKNRKIVQSSDVVFNESAMHKMIKKPIELQRVTFSEVSALHDVPTQNLRLALHVAESSCIESPPANLALINVSTLDHPT